MVAKVFSQQLEQAEKALSLQLAGELEERGFTVFLPPRVGADSSNPPYNEMTNDERS